GSKSGGLGTGKARRQLAEPTWRRLLEHGTGGRAEHYVDQRRIDGKGRVTQWAITCGTGAGGLSDGPCGNCAQGEQKAFHWRQSPLLGSFSPRCVAEAIVVRIDWMSWSTKPETSASSSLRTADSWRYQPENVCRNMV